MSVSQSDLVIGQYKLAYERLYNRTPQYLYVLDDNWVIVNGARMRTTELEYVTRRLDEEYHETMRKRQSIVQRLIGWLKN